MSIIPSMFALFNNWNFNNVPGLQVYAKDVPGQGQRTLNIFALAGRSFRKNSSAYYQKNIQEVSVFITASSRAALEQALDMLYANIQAQEGVLIIPMSGGVRAYTATYESTTINNAADNMANDVKSNYADLTLIFETSDSFGYDTNYTLIKSQTGLTSGNFTTPYNQGGTADTQVPFFQVQFTGTAPGAGTVVIGNQNTGQAISVTRNFAQNDLLQIDSRAKTVQVNGVDVVFSGAFPEFQPTSVNGTQVVTYNDNFASRTLNWLAYVYNRYA